MQQYVVYTRVSTAEQKKSGLGLQAQERDIDIFLEAYSEVPYEVLARFSDQGSGADNGRPELKQALALCRKTGAELLVAKLDRLSRRVSQIAQIMEDPKVKFRVASMPHADKFQLHIYSALAEQERDFISRRTKAALAAAKANGTKLGGWRGAALDNANKARSDDAQAKAAQVYSLIGPMREKGLSLAEIAGRLVTMEVKTVSGGTDWTPTAVSRVLARFA